MSQQWSQALLDQFAADDAREAAECYLPSPAEIAAACLEYQETWTEEERVIRRLGLIYQHPQKLTCIDCHKTFEGFVQRKRCPSCKIEARRKRDRQKARRRRGVAA